MDVSIPHRYATNCIWAMKVRLITTVSIPHRYATNENLSKRRVHFHTVVSIPHRYATNDKNDLVVYIGKDASFNPS